MASARWNYKDIMKPKNPKWWTVRPWEIRDDEN